MDLSAELARLHALHQNGALTDAEYVAAKAKLLRDQPSSLPVARIGNPSQALPVAQIAGPATSHIPVAQIAPVAAEAEPDDIDWYFDSIGTALAIVGGSICAALGFIDAQLIGGVAGAASGAILGWMCGSIIWRLIALVNPAWVMKVVTTNERQQTRCSHERKLRVWSCVVLILWALLAYEGYWWVNAVALDVSHNAWAALTRNTNRGNSRRELQDELGNKRFLVQIVRTRPLRWLLKAGPAEHSRAALLMIDVFTERTVKLPANASGMDQLLAQAAQKLLLSDNILARSIVDDFLNESAHAWCVEIRYERQSILGRTLLLRFIAQLESGDN